MTDASTSLDMSTELRKVAESVRQTHQRKSRMVEISKSGSGEGLVWATGPGYSTVLAGARLKK